MSFTDAEWDEVSQDIPSIQDPFLQKFLAGREELIDQEKTQRADASFRASLSPIAERACAIVDRIRDHEHRTVWDASVEEDLAVRSHQPIFPGMMFMMGKERMEETNLWKIVRKMPKGCLLHAHLDAMVDFDFIVKELIKLPGMHISSDRPLTNKSALEDSALQFRYRAKERTEGSLWSEEYKSGDLLLMTKMAEEFPNGGTEGFLKWLAGRCRLSLVDSHEQHHGIDAIWVKFAKCFVVVATMLHYEPIYRIFLRELMRRLMDDGVKWAELRWAPPEKE